MDKVLEPPFCKDSYNGNLRLLSFGFLGWLLTPSTASGLNYNVTVRVGQTEQATDHKMLSRDFERTFGQCLR